MISTQFGTSTLAVLIAAGLGFAIALFLPGSSHFDKPLGVAKLVDGATYTGEILDGRLHGKGTLQWPEGGSYEGEFKDGLLHGAGDFTDMFGNRYVGEFIDGQFSGNGKIYTEDGGVYEGQTQAWQMDGEGEYRVGASTFRGLFLNNVLTGQGEHLEDEKLVYRGMFQDWLYHGEGELFGEGGHWQGTFENGLLIRGIYAFPGGDHYEGEVAYRQYHGDGVLILANGDRYVGGFRYGDYHGRGTMYLAEARDDVTEYSGTWHKGRLKVSSQSAFVENYEADLELALYREAALLDAELGDVPDGDPDQVEIYFLGIAGDGTQRVFSREVTAFRDYFDKLNPLRARQINLINDRDTIGLHPMATLTSIERAIATLGGRMNLEQDLLVVYISSHGSKEYDISLKNEVIRLADLPASKLATMLKDSGIRWQVIFVSACYSGGFIEPLQTESTLIMTASASGKTSFGCSDEAEMTYFGQALLESLPRSETVEEVFKTLSVNIAVRESEESLGSSNPQLYVGGDIAEKLDAFPGLFKRAL